MFTAFDSLMFQLFSSVFFVALVILIICLILVAFFSVFIGIKRLIFGTGNESKMDDGKKNKDAVVGFALKNNNIRRE